MCNWFATRLGGPAYSATTVICVICPELERKLRHGSRPFRHAVRICVITGRLICIALHHSARRPLAVAAAGTGLEGSIYAGFEALIGEQLARRFLRDDGAELHVERCLIDANWGSSTDVVYQFCRQSSHSAMLLPSHGQFVGASSVPFSEYKRKLGDRVGHNWRIPNVHGKRAVRHVVFDTNYWKSFCHARLAVPMGDKGCLSLFGDKPDLHRLFAEHITAEYRVKTEGRGRTVDEWKLRPEAIDNHWLDCLVGCAVAASIQGVILPGTDVRRAPRRQRLKLSELQRSR